MSASKNHQAIGVSEVNAALSSIELPSPNDIGAHDVQVKVAFAALAHVDVSQAETGVYISKWPFIPGKEFSGTVTRVGEQVSDLAVGDRVIGLGYVQGSYQEYLNIPRAHVAPLPASYDLKTACTIPHTFAAAFVALFDKSGLQLSLNSSSEEKSAPILIWGASTATGIYAIQTLHHLGYTSILAVASTSHFERLKKLGASAVFDRSQPALVDAIKSSSNDIKLALVCQADPTGWTNTVQSVSSEGAHVVHIIRRRPENVPAGVKLSRTVAFSIVDDPTFGDVVISRYLANWLQDQTFEPAKPITLIDEPPELLARAEKSFELERAGETKSIVVRIA